MKRIARVTRKSRSSETANKSGTDETGSGVPATVNSRTPVTSDQVSKPPPRQVTMQDLGARDKDFTDGLMHQMLSANFENGELDDGNFRMMLSFVEGMDPRDPPHAALGLQMALINKHAVKTSKRLDKANTQAEETTYGRLFTSLTRTFGAQLLVHKRYGDTTKPDVKVQHVSVRDGGQAIVGNVTQNAAEALPNNAAPAPLAITDAKSAPVPRLSKQGHPSVPRVGSRSVTSGHRRNAGPMLSSPRCGATTRAGRPCRSPAVRGKRRCRMHGGAPGSGAPKGNQNALKHGVFTKDAIAERRETRALIAQSRKLLRDLS
jgi:hypothetical protein